MKESVKRLAGWVSEDDWPVLECPICREGTLTLTKDSLVTSDSRASVDKYEESGGDQMLIEGVFFGRLICNKARCGDSVAVAGDYAWEPIQFDLEKIYRVRTLHPAVRVVEPPESAPAPVLRVLERAAGVVWQDPPTGLSLLRQAVERLLDDQGVTKASSKGGYRSLGNRIAEFSRVNPDVAELLEAPRLVGNSGAHEEQFTAKEFIEIAQIIEVALEVLYRETSTAAREHAKRIVAAKQYVP